MSIKYMVKNSNGTQLGRLYDERIDAESFAMLCEGDQLELIFVEPVEVE